MSHWPQHPVIYEINTWVWLAEQSRKHRRRVDLGTVPGEEWDTLAALGFHAVWLMGVWERSPAERRDWPPRGALAGCSLLLVWLGARNERHA